MSNGEKSAVTGGFCSRFFDQIKLQYCLRSTENKKRSNKFSHVFTKF